MKVILYQNILPPYNLCRLTWDYFNRRRPLTLGGRVKHTDQFGWIYYYTLNGTVIRHVENFITGLNPDVGILTVSDDDIKTADGVTIFANTAQEYLDYVILKNQQRGEIPFENDQDKNDYLNKLLSYGVIQSKLPQLPPVGPHWVVDKEDLPYGAVIDENDYFFECTEWINNKCQINMGEARSCHMQNIREVRNKELAKLDVPFWKAIEVGDISTQRSIGERKQILRDIPTTFSLDSYIIPEELHKAWPLDLQNIE